MCDAQLLAVENISSSDSCSPQTRVPSDGAILDFAISPLARVSAPLFLHPNIAQNGCFGNQGVSQSEDRDLVCASPLPGYF